MMPRSMQTWSAGVLLSIVLVCPASAACAEVDRAEAHSAWSPLALIEAAWGWVAQLASGEPVGTAPPAESAAGEEGPFIDPNG